MALKRAVAITIFFSVLAGSLVLSKSTDLEILTRVSKTTTRKVHAALPDARRVAGPLAIFRAGDALPVEERVRVRIQTDKQMDGADVWVVPTETRGEIRLRGIVKNSDQKVRAVELANGTAGVDNVLIELAIPE
jgi:hypothetical protein